MPAVESKTIPFVDLNRQHDEIADELRQAFDRVMRQGSFTLGTEVEAFESEFASYLGTRDAVGVGSGTDALHFALRAVGVGYGAEVITAVNTFAATAEAIVSCGAAPVFVDIDPATYLMDLDSVEAAITPRTRAIVPVHLYGQCVDMSRVNEIAKRYGLKVVEDACQAHGSSRAGMMAGTQGDAGCFSFYPSKNLGAAGDGGIVSTNDPELAQRIRLLRNHGEDGQRLHVESAYCSRLHGLQAALLRVKLPQLNDWNASRVSAASEYSRAFTGSSVVLPQIARGAEHVFHLFVVRVPRREQLRAALAERGVQTAIHYQVPLHREPAFARFAKEARFPNAETAAEQMVSLPMFPHITAEEVHTVARAVLEATDA